MEYIVGIGRREVDGLARLSIRVLSYLYDTVCDPTSALTLHSALVCFTEHSYREAEAKVHSLSTIGQWTQTLKFKA